ncbi:MAG TPA: acyl carrier protein [Polyangiaceae bacterium]
MSPTIESTVLRVVADHVGKRPKDLTLSMLLQSDLNVYPLDLVVIALTLEDEERFAFPFDRLMEVRTVRDLVNAARLYGRADDRKISIDRALSMVGEALV